MAKLNRRDGSRGKRAVGKSGWIYLYLPGLALGNRIEQEQTEVTEMEGQMERLDDGRMGRWGDTELLNAECRMILDGQRTGERESNPGAVAFQRLPKLT
jgi:hypothetical protein